MIRHQRYIGKEREVDLLIGTLVPGAIISLITLRGNVRWSELDDCVKKSLTTALMFGRLFVNLHTWIQRHCQLGVSHSGELPFWYWIQEQTNEGVIRRPSSTFKLSRLIRDEDDRMIASASVAYSRQQCWRFYTLHGVGLLFFPSLRQAKARM